MGVRECPFCGRTIFEAFKDCPHCHETLPERRLPSKPAPAGMTPGRGMLRRGLLYMMFVAAIYYFLSPSSPLKLPVPFVPILTTYLLPLFFVMGLIFALYGIYQHVTG